MQALLLASACLAFPALPNTACGGAIEDLENATGAHIDRPSSSGQRDDEDEAERRQAWAEYRAEQAAERAAARERYNRELNQASQAAESSRRDAESSAKEVRDLAQELKRRRDATADPATAAAAEQRVRDARRQQADLKARLAELQKWTDSLAARNAADTGAAVRLSEDALYKVISPAQFVTPSMVQQARATRDAQLRELRELQEQSRALTAYQAGSDERTRLEQQVQAKAIFGLGSDLLDLLAPGIAKGSRDLKVSYEKVNLAAALINTAAAPDSAERAKGANESLSSYISYYNEAKLDPALADNPRTKAAVAGMGLSLKIANAVIDRQAAAGEKPGTAPAGLCNDYTECVKLALDLGGVVFPEAKAAHAVVSLNDRANQFARAQRAMAQIARMKGQGISAQEYIDDRILQLQRNVESSERTIQAYELGGGK